MSNIILSRLRPVRVFAILKQVCTQMQKFVVSVHSKNKKTKTNKRKRSVLLGIQNFTHPY